jgi:D-methionine transport system ATP-binding protein
MPILEINHLSKSFGKDKVLDDISLSVNEGDIFGVLGLSGAGKSTLVRCINGLESYDQGEIRFEGKLLSDPKHPIARSDRPKIAMIFQGFNLLEQSNVLENVMFPLNLVHQKDGKEKALAALKKVGLLDKIRAYPSTLSGGEKQRVAIARALVSEPKILLSDEATSALDPETAEGVLTLLEQLNHDLHLTIILISHQMSVVESICQKVAILSSSKLVEQGPLSEVFLNPQSEITKKLIYAGHIKSSLDDHKLLRLRFDGAVDTPLLADIVQSCGILVSVQYADSKVIDGKVYGQLIIKLPTEKKQLEKLYSYLQIHQVSYEEVSA